MTAAAPQKGKTMSECSCKDKTVFEGIVTELIAGKSLGIRTTEEMAHNNAIDRSIRIVKAYENGDGLFQICPVHGKQKPELAALEAVAEAAREWRRLWIDASDEIEERTGCDCEVCNLMRAVDALKKESK